MQVTPDVKAQAGAVLRMLLPMLEPADVQFRAAQIARLAAHYPERKRTDGQHRVVARDYERLLADFPADILSRAVDECIKTMKFLPSVSEIRECGARELSRRSVLRYRLKRVAAAKAAPPPPPPSTEQVADVDRMIARLKGRWAEMS